MVQDFNKRDELIFGNDVPDWTKGGTASFVLNFKQLQELVKARLLRKLETNGIYSFLEKYPRARAHGFAVSPRRDDVRIELEGVEIVGGVTKQLTADFNAAFSKKWKRVDSTYAHRLYCHF